MSALTGGIGGAAQGAAAGAWLGPWGAAAGGLVGGILGIFGGSAQDDAVEAKKQQSLEEARRVAARNAQTYGMTSAGAGASGLDMNTGSLAAYLKSMSLEFRRQNDWNVSQAYRGADIARDANAFGDFANIGKGLFGVAAANNFWRKPPETPDAGVWI